MMADSIHELLEPLNPAQREAVQHIDDPMLIIAGPGSGKTRVITHRIAYLIAQGIPSHCILALTFTNKAAEEMRVRLDNLVAGHHTWTGTFHKFCAKLLRKHASLVGLSENFTIYDTGDSKKVIKQAIQNTEVDLSHYTPESLLSQISNVKNSSITAEKFVPRPGHAQDAIVARVYPEYQKLLQMANGVDFDDLLLHSVDLLRESPELRQAYDHKYSYFMVDEYQDTNLTQYQLIRLLNHDVRNLAVTGDPDQSIYGWRGANINNILEFERDYQNVKVVRLEQNYRSTKAILRVADQLISNNIRRKPKTLTTDNDEGTPVRLVAYPAPHEEAVDIADSIALAIQKNGRRPRDYAIFYRTNYLSRALEHALRSAAVPYQVVNGHEFYQRKEIKDIVAYLHLLNNPRDNVAFERVINVPPRKIGKITVGRLRRFSQDHGISMLETARRIDEVTEISKTPSNKITKFVEMYDRMAATQSGDVESILKATLFETGYRDWLTDDGSEEGYERAANVDELVVAAQEFDSEHPDGGLETYLEQAALVSDTDVWESSADFVTLMTLHAAKGLEFPCVFLVGAEDGILPHERSSRDDEQLEEERRLMFVGITRAEQELQISRCISRFRRGSYWPAIASRFLMELPREEMTVFEPQSHEVNPEVFDGIDPWMHDGVDGARSPSFEGEELSVFYGDPKKPPQDDATDFPFGALENKQAKSESNNPTAALPKLFTGAELAAKQQENIRTLPSAYKTGMQVEHMEYGMGTIVMLSGQGAKRTATVDFPEFGNKRFRLMYSNLQIVENQSG